MTDKRRRVSMLSPDQHRVICKRYVHYPKVQPLGRWTKVQFEFGARGVAGSTPISRPILGHSRHLADALFRRQMGIEPMISIVVEIYYKIKILTSIKGFDVIDENATFIVDECRGDGLDLKPVAHSGLIE